MSYNTSLVKKTLSNGLTLIVDPIAHLPQVSMEILYHVGSKNEKTGEKGLAHLIEHMLFKGTQKLSETDVAAITHKISGMTNAFTTQDFTAYVFSMPSGNWRDGLVIFADCMQNARFDEQMLNSELKAVIQELKMRKDNYSLTLMESVISSSFHDHPYHYPIIGFKQDLWNLKRDTLYNFYKKHYIPNNATLVVVGDVNPEEVFQEVETLFGAIPADHSYAKEIFYHGQDLISRSTTLYRDVKLPLLVMQVKLPGTKEKQTYLYSFLERLLTTPKTGRLTAKLVDELQLVSYVFAMTSWCFEDAGNFLIMAEPYKTESFDTVKEIIHEEIAKLIEEGLSDFELRSISRKIKLGSTAQLESYPLRAHAIAYGHMIQHDEQHLFTSEDYPLENVNDGIKKLLTTYFSPSIFNYGYLLPMAEADKSRALELQEISDKEDTKILEGKFRTSIIEEPRAVHNLIVKDTTTLHLPVPEKAILSNGVKLFYSDNKATGLVTITITFKARPDYDHETLHGLYVFMAAMLTEGTKNYPGALLSQEFDKYGLAPAFTVGVWYLTCLPQDIEKALELLQEVLTNVTFENEAIEKVRDRILNIITMIEQEPITIMGRYIEKEIYNGHPWSKPAYGTQETINAITQKDIKAFYKKVITDDGMRVSVVGNIRDCDIVELTEKYIGTFKGDHINPITYPILADFEPRKITHYLNRDQVLLVYFRNSITRFDSRYDIFNLFQVIFSGGMSSRLFQLRQQSGIAYGIAGQMSQLADMQPGFFVVHAQVSSDRLAEAREVIGNTINTVVNTLTENDIAEAKKMLITQKIQSYASNMGIGNNILDNDRSGFADDYNKGYADRINSITLVDVQEAVREFLDTNKMSTLEIGRVEQA